MYIFLPCIYCYLNKILFFVTIFEYIFSLKAYFCCYRPKRSWGKVIFSEACVKNSVHGEGGLQAHTGGGEVGGSGGGGLRPRPRGGSRGVWLGVSRPTSGRGVFRLRVVRSLLECILVFFFFCSSSMCILS